MMRREAQWLGSMLTEMHAELGKVLSVGSGTRAFRTTLQPWIEHEVFDPLAAHGVTVLHHEMAPAAGVDVAGDLGDPAVRQRLRDLDVRTVLCLNVLEHVAEPAALAQALIDSVPADGRVIVTVPRRFPYHADPVDTLFRPSPSELAALFPGSTVVRSGTVRCESLGEYWLRKPGKVDALRKVLRRAPSARSDELPIDAASADRRHTAPSLVETLRMAIGSTEITYAVVQP